PRLAPLTHRTVPSFPTRRSSDLPFGPLLAWKRGDLAGMAQRLFAAFGGALLIVLFVYFFIDGASVLAALGIGLAFWLIFGALTRSEEHTSELQSRENLVCRLLLE